MPRGRYRSGRSHSASWMNVVLSSTPTFVGHHKHPSPPTAKLTYVADLVSPMSPIYSSPMSRLFSGSLISLVD